MDRRLVAPRLALSLLVSLVLAGCPEPPPKKSPSLASRIELAAGNVTVQQPGGSGPWTQAIPGLLLRHGTSVRVGAGDRALIRLDDGSGVFLRNGSEVTLEPDGLRLAAGQAWIDAPARDKDTGSYKAGDVAVSASDAGLDLKRQGGDVEVYVARGLAVVAAPGGRAEVKTGERAVIKAGKAPALSPVSFWEDWTGGMADRRLAAGTGGTGAGRIYALDRARPGTPPQELEVRDQHVGVTIREGVARTTVDQRFFNPSQAQVEGYYWFTIPEGAAVDRFALEVNNVLVDGEVIERKQAREAYESAIRQAFDPALLEWIDGRTFRARIFPIPAAGDRRVVLSYIELLPTVDNRTHYVYPMGGGDVQIQEFSLEVDLGDEGKKMQVATTADARVEQEGRKVTVRRSGYKPQGDFLLEMTAKRDEPVRAVRVASARNEAAYVMVRYTPDVNWDEVKKVPGDVVVVVDTSAGGDDADRQLRTEVAEAILRALSTSDRFAIMAADLQPRILWPDQGLATADEAAVAKGLERLAGVRPGGATDLGALFDVALRRLHGANQPAVVYIGDGRPTVGELGGDALAERVTRSMAGSSARLFTIAVGGQANHALLQRLARIGGGGSFRVDQPEQAVQEALRFVGNLKTPTITDLKLDLGAGLDQVFSSAAGKVSRGQEVTLVARTHHALPDSVKVSASFAGKPFSKTYRLAAKSGRDYSYVPTLWARRYLQTLMGADLQKNRGVIIRLGTDYALMTPFTSFLVLESEDQYHRMGIKRRVRDPIWGLVPQAALTLPEGVSDGVEAVAAAPLALFGCNALSKSAPAPDEEKSPLGASEPSLAKSRSSATKSGLYGQKGPGSPPAGATAAPAPPPADESVASEADSVGTGGGSRGGRATTRGGLDVAPARAAKARAEEGKLGARARPAAQRFAQAPRADAKDGPRGRDKAQDGDDRDAEQSRQAAQLAAAAVPVDYCSDASRRPLAHRRALWASQLDQSGSLAGWIAVYRRAQAHCEVPHQRDRQELLDLIQLRVSTPAEVTGLLAAIRDPKSLDFVRRQLLRRAVTPEMASVSAYAESVNWALAEAALARIADPQKRVADLRRTCAQYPQSVGCAIRLIRALVAAGKAQEALPIALKLRDDGRASPALMQEIGDLLVLADRKDDAMRAYSEIVEFAPADPAARQLLGDIYLRHGWYELAYRQYRTLTEYRPDDPAALLRLAAAAAGAGRVDESLRLERKVSGGEGEPGPTDPRRWARLWSAARVARLMEASSAAAKSERESMERTLRRLQVLTSPGVVVIVTWEDLGARLALGLTGLQTPDVVNAWPAGLFAVTLPPQSGASLPATVAHAGPFARAVKYRVTTIAWDGQRLSVTTKDGSLAAAGGQPQLQPQPLTVALPGR